jgi:hypothetical protein
MMISRVARPAAVLALAAGLLAASMTGCSKPPPPPPAPPPAPPPPPPAPDPVNVESVMASLSPDARVQFPQDYAPLTESLAKAVVSFADAFAKGDDSKVGAMLTPGAKATLDQIEAAGGWEDATKKLEAVRVVSLAETGGEEQKATSADVVLAFQEPGSSYVLTWSCSLQNENWLFDAKPAPRGTKPRASDWDGTSAAAGDADFGSGGGNTGPAPTDAGGGNTPPSPDAPAPDKPEEKKEDGPIRKNTPGGPVEIPRAPGGG